MSRKEIIELFLRLAKQYCNKGGFVFVPRPDSREFMLEHGLSLHTIRDVIRQLTADTCFDGPEEDRDPKYAKKWTVAEFSPMLDGTKLYLKISVNNEDQVCKCLSIKEYKERD